MTRHKHNWQIMFSGEIRSNGKDKLKIDIAFPYCGKMILSKGTTQFQSGEYWYMFICDCGSKKWVKSN